MYVYLSKKISIPNNVVLSCVAWNKADDYIACGGENGLLKVIKLSRSDDKSDQAGAHSSNLSMNQTLDGHNSRIQVLVWNHKHKKLTSSDQDGLIIVWMLYKGVWYEEMINNRNKSLVTGMSWSSSGEKICIVYADGGIIVGSIDGNRIWAKEMKTQSFLDVAWSPDGKYLLMSTKSGEVQEYDKQGEFSSKVNVICLPDLKTSNAEKHSIKLCWYGNSPTTKNSRQLCLFLENGPMQLMHDTSSDSGAIAVNTRHQISACAWSGDGSLLAVGGRNLTQPSADRNFNVVTFYTPDGQYIRSLRVPGRNLNSLDWDQHSQHLAIAVDHSIYFASLRYNYKFNYFSDTLVLVCPLASDKTSRLLFYDRTQNKTYSHSMSPVLAICAFGEYCCVAVENQPQHYQCSLLLLDQSGTIVDSVELELGAKLVSMSDNCVIAASEDRVIVWRFQTATDFLPSRPSAFGDEGKNERVSSLHIMTSDKQKGSPYPEKRFSLAEDSISSIECSNKVIVVTRSSGQCLQFTLPSLELANSRNIGRNVCKSSINCNNTIIALIDNNDILTFSSIEESSVEVKHNSDQVRLLKCERKDVSDVIWASDNPETCAFLEKNKLYIMRGGVCEEPISCTGYLCSFKGLAVTYALIEDFVKNHDDPKFPFVDKVESMLLRQVGQYIKTDGLDAAKVFIEKNPHTLLWKMFGEAALMALEINMAEAAYVHCQDYSAIRFCKSLKNIASEYVRKAEIFIFFNKFDECMQICRKHDNLELALELFEKSGYWEGVSNLLETPSIANDEVRRRLKTDIARVHAENMDYQAAAECYEQSQQEELQLARCYFRNGNYGKLETLSDKLMDTDPSLPVIAKMFADIGFCQAAVKAYHRADMISEAVNVCMKLNNWQFAESLISNDELASSRQYIRKYADHLLSKNQKVQVIELFIRAGCYDEAAKLMYHITYEKAQTCRDIITIKKMFVAAAFMTLRAVTKSSLSSQELFVHEKTTTHNKQVKNELPNFMSNPWKAAEAYHFLALAQRQIFNNNLESALKTGLLLRDYEDILSSEEVYCLLALTACANSAFLTASKAFIRLEGLESIPEERRSKYVDLAAEIFTRHAVKDAHTSRSECASCETLIPSTAFACPSCSVRFPPCIVTGQPIMDSSLSWQCSVCQRRAFSSEIQKFNNCALCHSPISARDPNS